MKLKTATNEPPPPEPLPDAWYEAEARIARLDALIATIPPDDYELKRKAGDKLWSLLTSLQGIIDRHNNGPVPCPACTKTEITPAMLHRPHPPRVCTKHDLPIIRARARANTNAVPLASEPPSGIGSTDFTTS